MLGHDDRRNLHFRIFREASEHGECHYVFPPKVDWKRVVVVFQDVGRLTMRIDHTTKNVESYRVARREAGDQTWRCDEVGPNRRRTMRIETQVASVDQGVGTEEGLEKGEFPC